MQPLWKTVWNFLKKIDMELPYNPVILLLGIYLKKPETLIRKNICTPMFIAVLLKIVLFIILSTVDEWIKKAGVLATAWMGQESIMLRIYFCFGVM